MKIKKVVSKKNNLPPKITYFLSETTFEVNPFIEISFSDVCEKLGISSNWQDYPTRLNPESYLNGMNWRDVEDIASVLKMRWIEYITALVSYARSCGAESREEDMEII